MNLADIEFDNHDHVVVAHLSGELDLSNVDNVRGALTEALPNQALGLVLDLAAVEYLDSSGIQLIYRLREDLRTRGQVLRLVVPAGSPSHGAMRLAGVAHHVETTSTVEEALSGLGDVPG